MALLSIDLIIIAAMTISVVKSCKQDTSEERSLLRGQSEETRQWAAEVRDRVYNVRRADDIAHIQKG